MNTCLYVFLTFICLASTKDVARINEKELMVVNDLIRRIRDDNWNQEEAPCLETTLTFLNNVKNLTLWATWVWDSNQSPTGNLYGSAYQMGNFDQCMNPPWLTSHPHLNTQYCTANVIMTKNEPQKGKTVWDPYDSTEEYINTASRHDLNVNTLHWGVCVPASCSARSVGKMLKHMYLGSQYSPLSTAPNITVVFCQVAGEDYQYPLGFYIFFSTIILLVGVAAASTVYQSKVDGSDQHPDALKTILSKAFCIKRNYGQLLKPNPAEIHVINGIRFLTSCLIVLVHQVFGLFMSPIMNPFNLEKDLESLLGFVFDHLGVVVDTFFAISGLLHVRGLMGNSARQKNLVLLLWKRYLRLLGPLAVSVFYQMYVAKYAGSGPFWQKTVCDEADVCANNWRLSLMMLNTNVKEICHGVTWYIACDYQLAILGTVLFYFYQRDKKLGYTAFGTAAALSVIIPGTLVYWHRLPAMPLENLRSLHKIKQRHSMPFDYSYTKSYVRANAYLVGMAMGYFMSVFKPADNRRAISTKWSVIGALGCIITMLMVVSLGKIFFDREYSVYEAMITASLDRGVWAFAVCCLIAFCEYGTVPTISNFLSLPVFVPLSRLAYGMYLIHPFVIARNLLSARSPVIYDKFSVFTNSMGIICTSTCISFVMWLLIEAPCINLSNALFENKSHNAAPLAEKQRKEHFTEEVKKKGEHKHNVVYAACNKTKTA